MKELGSEPNEKGGGDGDPDSNSILEEAGLAFDTEIGG